MGFINCYQKAEIPDSQYRPTAIEQSISYLGKKVGRNDATKNLKAISRDYKQLSMKAKDQGAQIVFSSVLLMEVSIQ